MFSDSFRNYRGCIQGEPNDSRSQLIIHTVVGGDTGDSIHVVFVGTDRLATFMNSFPLKIKP